MFQFTVAAQNNVDGFNDKVKAAIEGIVVSECLHITQKIMTTDNVNIIRACQLQPGDHFEMFNLDYKVVRIENGHIIYMKFCLNWNGTRYATGHLLSMGCMSRQFVFLLKPKPCSEDTKKQNRSGR